METTLRYLEAVKARLSINSDYALAKKLGLTQPAISNYRTNRSKMDDLTAFKVAELLEIDPAILIAQIHAERAKKPEEIAVWKSILERLGGVAAALLLGFGLATAPPPAQAAMTSTFDNNPDTLHIMRNRRCTYRRRKGKFPTLFFGLRMTPF